MRPESCDRPITARKQEMRRTAVASVAPRRAAPTSGPPGRRAGSFLETHQFPGIAPSEQLAGKEVVEGVTRFVRRESRQQGVSEQVEVADGVQNLVFDELIAVTQPIAG